MASNHLGTLSRLSGTAVCANGANGSSRAGQTYMAQDMQNDVNGATWYSIFYNHRIVSARHRGQRRLGRLDRITARMGICGR